ncbi:hypothetical protein SSP531S_42930 [Streptomyces spongiicola]|uniref:Uncharacterized protein n=1 Tax=Streptomyces spongiicola TaxID=1690221 RepID=A0A388T227_9ACTN|nr:hypothetical protein SSP531S_42930 [Streptomyces spongiicola]
MTEHGWETDAWPTPRKGDVLRRPRRPRARRSRPAARQQLRDDAGDREAPRLRRPDACAGLLNDKGRYAYYGRLGGCLINGDEDGVKHCAMDVLYSLQHLGRLHRPAAGGRRLDRRSRPGTVLSRPRFVRTRERVHPAQHHAHDLEPAAWLHPAAMLKQAGGRPAHGNRRTEWDAGCRSDPPNPEHR